MKNINRVLLASAFVVSSGIVAGGAASASESDTRIETTFKNSYVYKTYLKSDDVEIAAENGVVTLTGTVAEDSHKSLAQDTAESLSGVTRVENKLQTKEQVITDNADAKISRNVKLNLLFHRNVSYSRTTVEVKDGVVTLKGEATSMAQKELASEYAKDIDGVKSVVNEMTIAQTPVQAVQSAGEAIDDASVTAQVKTALLAHRSTRSTKTMVKTVDGVVTLTGIAKNAAEKSLVTKLVADIRGVNSVKNQMTVE